MGNYSCECKGIRTCSTCLAEGKIDTVTRKSLPIKILTENELAQVGIKVLKKFVDEQLHDELISHLSTSQWVDSQSGRRKLDFGPKVNFKKQKIKEKNFKNNILFIFDH